jgi:soluble lytic murein transglycosylase-like protein
LLTKALVILFSVCPLAVFAFCFDEAASDMGLNPALLRSIAKVESNNNPAVVHRNSDGTYDLGMMQINSTWLRPMGLDRKELLENPCYNVTTGARILKKCIDRHGYNWDAVGCYNAANRSARVKYSWKVFNELKLGHDRINDYTDRSLPRRSSLYFTVRDTAEDGP